MIFIDTDITQYTHDITEPHTSIVPYYDFQRFSLETERNGNQLVIGRAVESDAGVSLKYFHQF